MTYILAIFLACFISPIIQAASVTSTTLTEKLMTDVGFASTLPSRSGLAQATSSGYFILTKNLTTAGLYVLLMAPLSSSDSLTAVSAILLT